MNFYEITYGKSNEKINVFKYSYNKYMYILFKVFDPLTLSTVIILALSILVYFILNVNLLIISLLVVFISMIYFVLIRFDMYFQILYLLNWGLVVYFLNSISQKLNWTNTLELDLFIKDNLYLLELDFDLVFRWYIVFLSFISIALGSLSLINIRSKKNCYNYKVIKNKDLASYTNFIKSLTISRRLAFYFPTNLMIISIFPLLLNVPAKKEIFILLVFVVNCIYTKKFMYKYPYFFHYFINKKEAQLFNFNLIAIFRVLINKYAVVFINQYIYIVYLFGVFLLNFWQEFYFTDILYLVCMYLCSITIPLSEKKFIVFDYQTMKFNKDEDYGGYFEIITTFIFFILAMVKIGLELRSTPFNILLFVSIIALFLALISILKLYIALKTWEGYYENN
ncbi:hypothetical protein CKO30_14640 (plasmid) [Staphylococcus aureus]|nr:hypothetical protein [Staphylococcus aureus]MDN4125450.1 hypothetical protein [Staphylococcus aureus]PCF67959.1 hypothetical protein CKO30_14640 [Staphylococcus aureus]